MAAPDYKTDIPTRDTHTMDHYFKPESRAADQDQDQDHYFKPEGGARGLGPVTWGSREERQTAMHSADGVVYPVGRRGRRKPRPLPTGMNELKDLVLRKRVDIRRIHDTQSKAGAERFVAKYPHQGYTAHEMDLNDDGIPEVFVKRGDEFILINGYTTSKSDWARRQAYYSAHDDKAKRKANPQQEWLARDEMDVRYEDPNDPRIMTSGHEPSWNAAALTHGYKVTRAPKNLSTYRVFTSLIIKPLWDRLCEDPETLPYKRLYIKVVAHMWNNKIVFPALRRILDEPSFERVKTLIEEGGWTKEETKHYNQIKNGRVFKDYVWNLVYANVQLMRSGDPTDTEDLQGNIHTSLMIVSQANPV